MENITVDGDLTVDGQILASDGTAALPSYSFTNDIDTGMYLAGSNEIGFTTNGTEGTQISATNFLSTLGGTVTIPGINFGLNADTNTGIYHIAADTVGISTGGVQRLSVSTTELQIGTSGAIMSLKRLSATPANSWEDGYLGNSGFIYFTPTDFRNASTSRIHGVNSNTPTISGDPFVIETNSNTVDIVAAKLIPKGFRIKAAAAASAEVPAVYSLRGRRRRDRDQHCFVPATYERCGCKNSSWPKPVLRHGRVE